MARLETVEVLIALIQPVPPVWISLVQDFTLPHV